MTDDNNLTHQEEEDNSLREEFGLPALRSEPNAPPVDAVLLKKLVEGQSITDEELSTAMDCIGRFREWRDVYARMLIEDYETKKAAKTSGESPEPEIS